MVGFNGYLYIIHLREFINNEQEIYKVGRTNDVFRRFKQYPKGSKILCVFPTKDPVTHERIMLHNLCNKLKNRKDIGTEYFEGSLVTIMDIVHRIITKLHSNKNDITYKDVTVQTEFTDSQNNQVQHKEHPFTKFSYKH